MESREYRGPSDIVLLQAFNAAAVAEVGYTGFLHVGDIPHRLFNGLRWYDITDLVHIWEDGAGVAAWAFVHPENGWTNVQVRPGLRGGEVHAEAYEWAEATLLDRSDGGPVEAETEVWADDARLASLLSERGWRNAGDPYYLTSRSLTDVPAIELAPGYSIRSVLGVHEAPALAEVHRAGFGSDWTPELYRRVMESPGYDCDRELVAVAPDGTFAGFCELWFDEVNRTGLFEPLATHPEHRRRGIGSALIAAGLARMRSAGMQSAMVLFEGGNAGSRALYLGNGFEVGWELLTYRRLVSPGS